VPSPSMAIGAMRTGLTASSCGSSWSRWATSGLRPPTADPPDETMRSPEAPPCTFSLSDALVDEASTVMKITRVTPMVSAAAVVAVRLGLRMAFSLASVPAMPLRRGNGAPINQLSGRARSGPRTATPMNTAAAPTPTGPTPPPL